MRASPLGLVLASMGCGSAVADMPDPVLDSTTSSTGSPSGDTTSSGGDGSSSVSSETGRLDLPDCAWTHERAPEVFAEATLEPGIIVRAVPSPDDAFYLVGYEFSGPPSDSDADVMLWKLSDDGEVLWSARWGNAYGWDDVPYDVIAGPEGVFVTGAAAVYLRDEFWSSGHRFVRAYSHGGVARWTWEDEGGPSPDSYFRSPKMSALIGDELVVGSSIPGELAVSDELRVVVLSAEGEAIDEWGYPRDGHLLAVHVDAEGDVLMAVDDLYTPWLGRWRLDGTFVDPEIWDGGGAADAAAFVGDDGLVVVGGGDGLLSVLRFDSLLGVPDQQIHAFDEEESSYWSYATEVVVDCAGAAWVTADSPSLPLGAYGAAAEQLWTSEGLSVVAVADDGVALIAGYDADADATAVRWLRP